MSDNLAVFGKSPELLCPTRPDWIISLDQLDTLSSLLEESRKGEVVCDDADMAKTLNFLEKHTQGSQNTILVEWRSDLEDSLLEKSVKSTMEAVKQAQENTAQKIEKMYGGLAGLLESQPNLQSIVDTIKRRNAELEQARNLLKKVQLSPDSTEKDADEAVDDLKAQGKGELIASLAAAFNISVDDEDALKEALKKLLKNAQDLEVVLREEIALLVNIVNMQEGDNTLLQIELEKLGLQLDVVREFAADTVAAEGRKQRRGDRYRNAAKNYKEAFRQAEISLKQLGLDGNATAEDVKAKINDLNKNAGKGVIYNLAMQFGVLPKNAHESDVDSGIADAVAGAVNKQIDDLKNDLAKAEDRANKAESANTALSEKYANLIYLLALLGLDENATAKDVENKIENLKKSGAEGIYKLAVQFQVLPKDATLGDVNEDVVDKLIATITGMIEDLNSQLKNEKDRADTAQRELTELTTRFQNILDLLGLDEDASDEAIEARINALKEEGGKEVIREVEKALDVAEGEDVYENIEDLRKQLENQRARADRLKAIFRTLIEVKNTLTTKLKEYEQTVEALKKKITAKEEEIRQLGVKNRADDQAEDIERKKEREKFEKEKEEFEKLMKEKWDEINTKLAEITAKKESITLREAAIAERLAEIAQKESEMGDIQSLSDELKNKEEALNNKEQELMDEGRRLAEWEDDIQIRTDRVKETEKNAAELENKLQKLRADQETLALAQSKLEGNQKAFDEARVAFKREVEYLEEREEKVRGMEEEKLQLEREKRAVFDLREALDKRAQTLKEEWETLEAQKSEYDRLKAELDEKEVELANLEEELNQRSSQLDGREDAQNERDEALNQRETDLNTQESGESEALAQANRALAELQGRLATLESENTKLQKFKFDAFVYIHFVSIGDEKKLEIMEKIDEGVEDATFMEDYHFEGNWEEFCEKYRASLEEAVESTLKDAGIDQSNNWDSYKAYLKDLVAQEKLKTAKSTALDARAKIDAVATPEDRLAYIQSLTESDIANTFKEAGVSLKALEEDAVARVVDRQVGDIMVAVNQGSYADRYEAIGKVLKDLPEDKNYDTLLNSLKEKGIDLEAIQEEMAELDEIYAQKDNDVFAANARVKEVLNN